MNLRPKFISIPDNIQHTSSDANNELEPGQHPVLDVLDSTGTSSNTLLLTTPSMGWYRLPGTTMA